MIEGIPISLGDLGGWAIMALMVVGLLTGKGLATRREVEAEKARADKWQEAWEAAMVTIAKQAENGNETLEHQRAAAKILDVLYEQAMKGRSS